jgi:hypothetical protein
MLSIGENGEHTSKDFKKRQFSTSWSGHYKTSEREREQNTLAYYSKEFITVKKVLSGEVQSAKEEISS